MICKVCGTKHTGITYEAKEMMFGLKDCFIYFQCAVCDCLQIKDIPQDISKYYPQDYYSFAPYNGKKFEGIPGEIYKLRVKSSLFEGSIFYRTVARLFPVEKFKIFKGLVNINSRILDVGCGNGDMFLYPFVEVGIENAMGCDPFIPADLTYNNGLKILKSDIFNMNGQWDIIIYNHSFEHVPNPLENLTRASELLTKGGVCILRIPTVPNYAWKHYGINWAQLDAPRHLFLHSPKSITILAEQSGLSLDNIIYDSTFFQFSGSEALMEGIPLLQIKEKKTGWVKRKLERRKYSALAKKLNQQHQGDQASFILVKK